MNQALKKAISIFIFIFISAVASAQYKMDSDGKTLRNSNNSSVEELIAMEKQFATPTIVQWEEWIVTEKQFATRVIQPY